MTLRARDARERLKDRADLQVSYCIEALAEQHGVLKQQVMGLAEMLDQMTRILTDLTSVAVNMKAATNALKRIDPDDDDGAPPVTQ